MCLQPFIKNAELLDLRLSILNKKISKLPIAHKSPNDKIITMISLLFQN